MWVNFKYAEKPPQNISFICRLLVAEFLALPLCRLKSCNAFWGNWAWLASSCLIVKNSGCSRIYCGITCMRKQLCIIWNLLFPQCDAVLSISRLIICCFGQMHCVLYCPLIHPPSVWIVHSLILLWQLSFVALSVNHLNIIANISHSSSIPTCSFTQIWDLALHSGRRLSECSGVCVSVQPVECCVHERLFFPHSVGGEEWAAVELRTLIPLHYSKSEPRGSR